MGSGGPGTRRRRFARCLAVTIGLGIGAFIVACTGGEDRDERSDAPPAGHALSELETHILSPEGLGVSVEVPRSWVQGGPKSGFAVSVAPDDEDGPFLLADRLVAVVDLQQLRYLRRQQLTSVGATIAGQDATTVGGHRALTLHYELPDPEREGAVVLDAEFLIEVADGTVLQVIVGEWLPAQHQDLLGAIVDSLRVEPVDLPVEVVELGRAGTGLVGQFHAPPQPTGMPAVLALGGSEGGIPAVGVPLARAGHPTLSLAYFGEEGLPEHLLDIPLEYLAEGLRWLGERPEVDPDRLVVWGGSRGGEAALLLGAHFPDLVHAVVAHVPANVVVQGFPFGGPSWTLGGAPLTTVRAFPHNDVVDHPEAEIPVELISGPVLLTCGEQDELWASCPMARAVRDRLTRHDHPFPVELHAEPDGDHAIVQPPWSLLTDVRTADSEAWRVTLDFLEALH